MQNILVVDDDTDLLMILKRSLSRHGYNVTTLSDPARVHETIDLVNPAIIVLDINMGDWDGREVCKSLKGIQAYQHIPVVLYSALVDGSIEMETCKADLFLQKPLTTKMLATHLSKLKSA